VILLAALVALAWGDPPVGSSALSGALWARAEQAELRGDPVGAARIFLAVDRAEPSVEARLAAARALLAGGLRDEAIGVLTETSIDRDARVLLAATLLDADEPAAALATLREVEAILGADPEASRLRAIAAARAEPDAAEELGRWLETGAAIEPLPVTIDAAQAIGRALLDAGRPDDAARVLDEVAAAVPGATLRLAALRDEAAMRAAAADLRTTRRRIPDVGEVARLREARAALAAGEAGRGRAILAPLTDAAPDDPELRGLRAQARAATGDAALADQDLRAAEALDPLDARWPAERGLLLDEAFGGRFAAEIYDAWSRSLRLRPDQPELRARWARLGATLGRDVEVAVGLAGQGSPELAALAEDLGRVRLPADPLPPARRCPDGVAPGACDAFALAWVYARRGAAADPISGRPADREVALASVADARAAAPAWTAPINLEASLHLAPHDDAAARARARTLLEESLRLDPEQPEILVVLGRLYEADGEADRAVAAWTRAVADERPAAAGAHVYLAERAWATYRPDRAAGHLATYRALAPPGAVASGIEARAAALERRVRGLRDGALALGGVGVLAGVGLAVGWGWRRARRRTVAQLLQADPGSWREVARITAALRHEVLKHALGALPEVARALDAGDVEPAAWLSQRLTDPEGPLVAADRRVGELRALAAGRGIVLDLRGLDPVFAPLGRALARLSALAPALARGDDVSDELRAVDATLREVVAPGLARLVASASTLTVDAAALDAAVARARADATASWRDRVAIVVEPPAIPLRIRAFRQDLDDVLVNLIRNAAAASPDGVAVSATLDEDPITALRSVAIRVADRAPRRLTTAMIRGRYIERGLGLTVDLVGRMGGGVTVQPHEGYEKAVVVRLPLVEDPEEDA
jgi:signal transduction histidine kinase